MTAKKLDTAEHELNKELQMAERLRIQLAMLDAVQPDVDRAIDQFQREIAALSAEARHHLKTWEERIACHGETPPKHLHKTLETIQQKQEMLCGARPEETIQFLRSFQKYVSAILKLNEAP